MRIDRDRLIFLGLVALQRNADAAYKGPVRPTLELRAVLAHLYALSDGKREPYDGFWKAIQDPHSYAKHPNIGNQSRGTEANGCIEAIWRGLGWPPTPDLHIKVWQAARASDRSIITEAIRSANDERNADRVARDCAIDRPRRQV